MSWTVTLVIPDLIAYTIFGWSPPDDKKVVIGLSMVAYLSENDPGHVFLPAATMHDSFFIANSEAQCEGMQFWRANSVFLEAMLAIAHDDLELQKKAYALHHAVAKWGRRVWEGDF